MQFRHPEILYALFLLIIPILIHLFRLQRFRTEAFTNVRILREIEMEARKSSRLKKLLLLLVRSLALACLVFAFAQPFISGNDRSGKRQVFMYLDNSMSMQARAKNGGTILDSYRNGLVEDLGDNSARFTLITNDKVAPDLDADLLKKEVLRTDFYPIKKELNQVFLEIEAVKKRQNITLADIILLSDFQNFNSNDFSFERVDSDRIFLIEPESGVVENISLDTIWYAGEQEKDLLLKAVLSSRSLKMEDLSVSFYLDDDLFGKASVNLEAGQSEELDFKVPANRVGKGRIELTDQRMNFDNTLYFRIPARERLKVLAVGPKNEYLQRIYGSSEFDFQEVDLESLEPRLLEGQDLLLLHEVERISNPLSQTLKDFLAGKGNLAVIPAANADLRSYDQFLVTLGIGNLKGVFTTERKVTDIQYDNPFYNQVFLEEVRNFHYPTVQWGMEANIPGASSLLLFEDGESFVSEIPYGDHKLYWITTPLDAGLTDFVHSPLVVPVFFNFSMHQRDPKSLYYLIGKRNEIVIPFHSDKEDAVVLEKDGNRFIPNQNRSSNRLKITTESFPIEPGIYQIIRESDTLEQVAFNYDREENSEGSERVDLLKSKRENLQRYESLSQALRAVNELYNNKNLWQLFIIFVLVFLTAEMLIQKFIKN